MLKFISFVWVGALTAGLVAAQPAHANSSVILGVDTIANAMGVPLVLCVSPGQDLRLIGDVVDINGRRGFLPAEAFVWRLTRSNGFWEQWDASRSAWFGPFRRALDVPNAVYVRVPFNIGPGGLLENLGRGAATIASIRLVDPNSTFPPTPCQWGPAAMYVGGPPVPAPAPTPAPVPPAVIYPCYDACYVDAVCSDSCPSGAQCEFVPGGVPHWRVLSCSR